MFVQFVDKSFSKHQEISILDLPTEILSEIFKEVVTSSFRSDDPKELRENFTSLCLVHPIFCVITQDITIPSRLGLHLSHDEWVSVDPNENDANAKILKDTPKQWRLLFECWETMKTICPNMDKNTFRDHITLLKKNAVEDDVIHEVFCIEPVSLRYRTLWRAAFLGYSFFVKFILSNNSNISIYLRGRILQLAALHGHLGVVKELLKEQVISADVKGESLRLAARSGYLEVVKELLNTQGISADAKDESLKVAALYGYLEVVKELLQEQEISAAAKGESLKCAARCGFLDVVKELLNYEISAEYIRLSLEDVDNNGFFWGVKPCLQKFLKDHEIPAVHEGLDSVVQ